MIGGKVRVAERLNSVPPYLFAEIDRKIAERKAMGHKVISFGVGDPDMPTPPHIVEALQVAAADPSNHRYPSYRGMQEFREAAADWYRRRFGVSPDPEREVLGLIGSKDGISHFPLAFVDPGDIVLVPDPSYPVYAIASSFAGGVPYYMPLREDNGFLPDLDQVPPHVLKKAKIIFLNYPNNPTTGVADLRFFREVVEMAREYDIIVAHDLAYSEITFDGYIAPSILEVDGAKEISIEFCSLSKTYNMTGWRVGFAVGGERIIGPFGNLKTNMDSGVFNAVQLAAREALTGPQDCLEQMRETYGNRRGKLLKCLEGRGWEAVAPRGTIYIWMKVPAGHDSASFAEWLLEEADIVVVPGSAYGKNGEGYVRLSLSLPDEELEEALNRLERCS
jgi:LL-diaminopimelate aminotransferase